MTSNPTINVSVRLFGAFRPYGVAPIVLSLPAGVKVAAIKAALGQAIQGTHPSFAYSDLLEKSVLANDQAVLNPTDQIFQDTALAILPPVCGG